MTKGFPVCFPFFIEWTISIRVLSIWMDNVSFSLGVRVVLWFSKIRFEFEIRICGSLCHRILYLIFHCFENAAEISFDMLHTSMPIAHTSSHRPILYVVRRPIIFFHHFLAPKCRGNQWTGSIVLCMYHLAKTITMSDERCS